MFLIVVGKYVLCEKLFVVNVQDVIEMVDVVEKVGIVNMVNLIYCNGVGLIYVVDMVVKGLIGEVCYFEVVYL